jgi:hypothetical protein
VHRECERDGFPMLRIHGRWECVAEYLNRCIGMKTVVDMIQRGRTVYYVFEDGHELPLLCFCCSEPLQFDDLEKSRQEVWGRKLESMSWEPIPLDDGTEACQFCLELSGKTHSSLETYMPVSVKVAAQLRHPAHCSQKARPPIRKRKRPKKRRRR